METLASGYGLVEGPRAAPDGSVYFSDAVGGSVHRWSPDGRVITVVPKRRGVGGLNTDDPARGGTLFRVRVDVPGLPPPLATV